MASTTFLNEKQPVVMKDPRFQAGRALIPKPQAVDLFALLLEEARAKFGDNHMECSILYYEYGNALLRTAIARLENQEEEKTALEQQTARDARAAAAERRLLEQRQTKPLPSTVSKTSIETENSSGSSSTEGVKDGKGKDEAMRKDDGDISLALEMMETAWAILDEEQQKQKMSKSPETLYADWMQHQIPRVLTGIGDVLSELCRHADAADAYLRALEHYQNSLEQVTTSAPENTKLSVQESLKLLELRRKTVEANILVVEELLACDPQQDVITSEAKIVLVKAGNVVDYAHGYYNRARDEMQETLLLMAQMAADHMEFESEKDNIRNTAILLMGAGEKFAAIDHEAIQSQERKEPCKKKPRTAKG
jgi:tetratricopeptide (TPR) repeat protein